MPLIKSQRNPSTTLKHCFEMNHGAIVALSVLALMLGGSIALPFARRENRNTAQNGENDPVADNGANLFLIQSDGKGCFVMKEEQVTTIV